MGKVCLRKVRILYYINKIVKNKNVKVYCISSCSSSMEKITVEKCKASFCKDSC